MRSSNIFLKIYRKESFKTLQMLYNRVFIDAARRYKNRVFKGSPEIIKIGSLKNLLIFLKIGSSKNFQKFDKKKLASGAVENFIKIEFSKNI